MQFNPFEKTSATTLLAALGSKRVRDAGADCLQHVSLSASDHYERLRDKYDDLREAAVGVCPDPLSLQQPLCSISCAVGAVEKSRRRDRCGICEETRDAA